MGAHDNQDYQAAIHLYKQLKAFGGLLSAISDNNGVNYEHVTQVPSHVYSLSNAQSAWDALAVTSERTTQIMESPPMLYSDWSAVSADFASILSKAPAFGALVESNVAAIPMTYAATGRHEFKTASQSVQDTIQASVDDILQHF